MKARSRYFYLGGFLLLLVVAYFFFRSENKEQDSDIFTTVSQGEFYISVSGTGELKAKNSVKIRAPQGMRPAGIYETTLSDLVPEGTIVSEGQYVGSLDRTEISNKMSTVRSEIEKIETQLEQAKIDTAIEMRALRDQLVNLNFSKKEKMLLVEQNKYEAHSVIRQTELDLEKIERDYSQLEQKYVLKEQQTVAKIREINALLRQNQQKFDTFVELSDEFSISAPTSGMVIYARTWNGKKEPGSRISAWDPVVAELPDLTDMISKTYVNEVDISKVKPGQEVKVKVDAFPEENYSGVVLTVANIGEQLRGYDSKVFEVVIQINESDTIMRPAMTTSNEIITDTFHNVMFVPLECLQTDSLSFVYLKQKGETVKKEVITGLSNDNQIIIEQGIEPGDQVFLSIPKNNTDLRFIPIDPEIKKEILRKQEEAKKEREARSQARRDKIKNIDLPSNSGRGDDGMFIIIE
ncbi:MAG: HlyD family secretion protein [Saprospiraceae bacterium]|nr:HlyD family secretion protein [Saprospiraceae bacterium]MCB9322312.1 HlyD family secretion protein [Lewinellaceae bacterium]